MENINPEETNDSAYMNKCHRWHEEGSAIPGGFSKADIQNSGCKSYFWYRHHTRAKAIQQCWKNSQAFAEPYGSVEGRWNTQKNKCSVKYERWAPGSPYNEFPGIRWS